MTSMLVHLPPSASVVSSANSSRASLPVSRARQKALPARLGATKAFKTSTEKWNPQQAKWIPGLFQNVLPLTRPSPLDSLTRQELIARLEAVTRDRDCAVSAAHQSRLEASHLRGEKERLHSNVTCLQAQKKVASQRLAALERTLRSAEHLEKANLWHAFCTARKKLLRVQEEVTDKESESYRLARAVKQEERANQSLRAQLAAAQEENASLKAILDASKACTSLVPYSRS